MPTKKSTKKLKDFKKVFFLKEWEIYSGIIETEESWAERNVLVQYINNQPIENFILKINSSRLREDKKIYTEEFC